MMKGKDGKAMPRKGRKGHPQKAERPSPEKWPCPGKGGKAIPRKMMKGKGGKAMPRKGRKGHPQKRPSPENEGEGWKSHAQERAERPSPEKAIPRKSHAQERWKPRKLIDLTQKHDQNNL